MELFVLYPAMLACRHLCTGADADVYADADGGAEVHASGQGCLRGIVSRLLSY